MITISNQFQQDSVRQWGRLKGNLFHYFLRNHPDAPWKYYLTDYARNVVELMKNKLENPYKEHPLRKSVEDSFTIKFKEIKTIDELERKFGRVFIQGSKKIITDHLEALADELKAAYHTLNDILRNDDKDATVLVGDFTIEFRKFGSRAEDITNAILSKDKFLRDLQSVVDDFYFQMEDNSKFNEIDIKKSIDDWEKSRKIYLDISDFFIAVDEKISLIRRQINHASDKLSELQEQFSSRAHFKVHNEHKMQEKDFNLDQILDKMNDLYLEILTCQDDARQAHEEFDALIEQLYHEGYTFSPINHQYITELYQIYIKVIDDKKAAVKAKWYEQANAFRNEELRLKAVLGEIVYFTAPGDDKMVVFFNAVEIG